MWNKKISHLEALNISARNNVVMMNYCPINRSTSQYSQKVTFVLCVFTTLLQQSSEQFVK